MVGSPAPARRPPVRRRLVATLLAGRGDERPAQVAGRRQAPPIAHEVHARQGHERGELLQEFQW